MIDILFAALLASAAPETASAVQPPEAPAATRERVICRRNPVVGTRLRYTEICLTREQWNARRGDIARGMREQIDRSFSSMPPPPISPGSN